MAPTRANGPPYRYGGIVAKRNSWSNTKSYTHCHNIYSTWCNRFSGEMTSWRGTTCSTTTQHSAVSFFRAGSTPENSIENISVGNLGASTKSRQCLSPLILLSMWDECAKCTPECRRLEIYIHLILYTTIKYTSVQHTSLFTFLCINQCHQCHMYTPIHRKAPISRQNRPA